MGGADSSSRLRDCGSYFDHSAASYEKHGRRRDHDQDRRHQDTVVEFDAFGSDDTSHPCIECLLPPQKTIR